MASGHHSIFIIIIIITALPFYHPLLPLVVAVNHVNNNNNNKRLVTLAEHTSDHGKQTTQAQKQRERDFTAFIKPGGFLGRSQTKT